MRICFLLHNAYGIGGTIRSTFNLAAALAERHEVEIVSALRHREVPTMGAPPGVRLTPLVDLRAAVPGSDGDDPRHGEPAEVFPRADGRHKQYSALTDARIGRYLSRLEADVVVGTRPGLNVHIARQARPGIIRVGQEHLTLAGHGLRMRHEIRHRYRLLDALTTVTDADARTYRRIGPPGLRVEAVPNSVPAARADPCDGTARVIVAAGRLTPVKRYDVLLRAFAEVARAHPDWQLRIFGSGDHTGDEKERLTALIRALGLTGSAHLMGNSDRLDAQWAQGSVAVSTSDQESFGMTIVEAMRCGVPVVSTDCPVGPREIIEDRVDGRLVPPGDPGAVAAALLDLVGDDRLRRRMGEAARRNAARFDPAGIAERHLGLYEELLRRGPGRRSLGRAREAAHRSRTTVIDTAHTARALVKAAGPRFQGLGTGTPARRK
ncbi:glycosyltransferase family 4 protein [Streptomyces sp. NPDC059917]|uniref:glycosyltransferase family 4 protein n=1 Tax=Streptomyces sp. NPDC059917 TaxID=3347002 RepID=UPI003659D78F